MDDVIDAPVSPTPQGLMEEARRLRTSAGEEKSRLDSQVADLDKQREAARATSRQHSQEAQAGFAKAAGEMGTAMAGGPEQVAMPDPHLPPAINPKEANTFVFGMLAMTALATKGGRGNMQMAMAGLAGALQGYKQGAIDKAKEAQAQFEREFRTAMEKQKEANKKYDEIIKSKNMSLNMQLKMIGIQAAADGDEELYLTAKRGEYDKAYKLITQKETMATKLEGEAAKMNKALQAKAAKMGGGSAGGAHGGDATLDDSTLQKMAEQYLAGDRSVFQNLGRGAQSATNVVRLRKMVEKVATERGMSGEQIAKAIAGFEATKSAQRTVGTRLANIEVAASEAYKFADLAADAAAKVPRTNFVPLNKLIQKVQEGTASPEQARFVVANRSLITAYGQVVARSSARTVHDTQEMEKMLETADGHDAYLARIDQLKKEIEVARQAPKEVRENLMKDEGGAGKTINFADLPP